MKQRAILLIVFLLGPALLAKAYCQYDIDHKGPGTKSPSDVYKVSAPIESTDSVNRIIIQGEEQNPPAYLHELLLPQNLPNIALVLVGIVGILVAVCTLKAVSHQAVEMRWQRIEIQKQRHEMRRQRIVMSDQLETMHGQLAQMQTAGEQTERLISETGKSAAAAEQSADAARLSAEIAVGVSVPTLVVHEFDTGESGATNMEALLQYPTIKLVIKNYGQTPALLHSWTVIFTCEDLPEVPVYFGFPGSGMVLDKVSVQPNESYTFPRMPTWNRQDFSIHDVKMIISRKKTLNVYGYVAYRDIFGNPLRRMKFCETALNLFDGPKPAINWANFEFSAYTGTDLYPTKRT